MAGAQRIWAIAADNAASRAYEGNTIASTKTGLPTTPPVNNVHSKTQKLLPCSEFPTHSNENNHIQANPKDLQVGEAQNHSNNELTPSNTSSLTHTFSSNSQSLSAKNYQRDYARHQRCNTTSEKQNRVLH